MCIAIHDYNKHDARMAKNDEDYKDMVEELKEAIEPSIDELKEVFNKIVSKSGFEYSFEDFIKDEI